MACLVYSMPVSVDGCVADARGAFGWAEPSEEVHRRANQLQATGGTCLYGRRMSEVTAVWQDWPGTDDVDDRRWSDRSIRSGCERWLRRAIKTYPSAAPRWPTGARLAFDLADEQHFADGTVCLHYRARG